MSTDPVAAPLPLMNMAYKVALKVCSSSSLAFMCFVGCVLAFRAFLGHFCGLRRADLWSIAP
jgi:hypothetical protein